MSHEFDETEIKKTIDFNKNQILFYLKLTIPYILLVQLKNTSHLLETH